ncbi:ISA1, partial [Symbiodinium sp. KB8]
EYVRNPKANIAGLREIDRQVMLFALIPRLLQRIRIFCMMSGLEERKTEAFRKLRDLSTTLNRLRASETLKHIIAVVTVLYNYINHETHPDAARQLKGVDIGSLAALRNTKCNTGVGPITNYNMLHFAIQQMLQQDPTRTLQEFQDDVRGLRDHKGLKWETCMQEAKRLQEDFTFVQRELSVHLEAYLDPDMELFEVALKAQPFAEVMLSHPYGEQVILGINSAEASVTKSHSAAWLVIEVPDGQENAISLPGKKGRFLQVQLQPLSHRTGHTWHVQVAASFPMVGLRYAWRIDPEVTDDGEPDLTENTVLDPFGRCLTSGGEDSWNKRGDDFKFAPMSVVPDFRALHSFDWQGVTSPGYELKDLIIYEAHVRSFTKHEDSDVQAPNAGTFLGFIEKIPHLVSLGINCVELLPIFEFDESQVPRVHPQTGEFLCQYWGYQT